MSKVAPYGSWVSTITPDLFAKGNCKGIAELQATDDGVFWVEQSASTGKRELYFESAKEPSAGRVRWAPEQSVQNSGKSNFLQRCAMRYAYRPSHL
ncbi:unnamed protein product [Cylicostephanus goldi]|uniref:Uncharacterized protein n=1 Tax=Cylicostephanus goldi TaxID=71465 RepID=A0A3P7MSH3_CYLGO|nr:unnamed protein product [Cylicostephanus goldi]